MTNTNKAVGELVSGAGTVSRVIRGTTPSRARRGRYESVLVVVDSGPGMLAPLDEALRIGYEHGALVVIFVGAEAPLADPSSPFDDFFDVAPGSEAAPQTDGVAIRESLVLKVRRLAYDRMPPLVAVVVACQEGTCGAETILEELEPDVVLLAAGLPGAAGVAASALRAGTNLMLTPAVPVGGRPANRSVH